MDNVGANSPAIKSENNASADAKDSGFTVARSINERLKKMPTFSTECSIYSVPEKFRKVNEEAYTPQLVSIGPLHYGIAKLRSMEDTKLRYLGSFKNRTNADLLLGARYLKENEEHVRQCYQESTTQFSSDKFVEMILVDAIFIIELFMRNNDPDLRDTPDEIFNKQWMINGILHDMLLLENQLPFFVLEYLYNRNPTIPFLELCGLYFKDVLNVSEYFGIFIIPTLFKSEEVRHLVGFVTNFLQTYSRLSDKPTGRGRLENPRSVTELQKTGVHFEAVRGASLLNISFIVKTGTLKIPQIVVDDLTETFLRNTIAFEQCHHVDKFISGYVIFMDSLINTPKDVDILIQYGIIENQLGDSEDVSTLFNNLYKETIREASQFCYGYICHDLSRYRTTLRYKLNAKLFQWKVSLKRDYFGNPWSVISVFAAVVLLILTIIQTTCSVIAL